MKISYFFSVFAFLLCSNLYAAEPLDIVKHWKMHPMSLSFEAFVDGHKTMSGRFWSSPQGLFRLETNGEFHQVIVNDGHDVWLWDRSLQEVSQTPVSLFPVDSAFVVFTHSWQDLLKHFYVRVLSAEGNQIHYRFLPQKNVTVFSSCDLYFVHGSPHVVVIHKPMEKSSLVLKIMHSDQAPVDPHRFRFVVPAGVDVIHPSQGEE